MSCLSRNLKNEYELAMAFQARDQHVQNYRTLKKKKKNARHDFPMKTFLDSPEKKQFSCPSEFRARAPQWISLQDDKVLEEKRLPSHLFFKIIN